jgi:hypothetical protein
LYTMEGQSNKIDLSAFDAIIIPLDGPLAETAFSSGRLTVTASV